MQELRQIFHDNTLVHKTIFGSTGVRNWCRLLLIHLLFAFGTTVSYAQTSQTYSIAGTYTFTVPAGVTSVTVECWGGGGAGGGNTTNANGGGGGGGGAYSKTTNISVPGTAYTVTVGAGGIGGTGNGGAGSDSWFNTSVMILAKAGTGGFAPVGGNAGISGAGGAAGTGVGTTKFSGGNGGTGNSLNNGRGGGGGSSAGTAIIGTVGGIGGITPGIGGIAPVGGGNGSNGGDVNANGVTGAAPGGGGGGAGDGNHSGGSGAAGQVKITWFSLTSTSAITPICSANSSTITLTSSVAGLPTGTYSVTYDLSAPNASASNTATLVVTTAGTGSFETITLANSGSTTITITNLSSGIYSNAISTNNTTIFTVNPSPTANAGPGLSPICIGGTSTALGGSVGGGGTGGIWTDGGIGGTFSLLQTDLNATWSPPALYTGLATLTLSTFGGSCGTITASKTIEVVALPTVSFGPAMTSICQDGTSASLGGNFGGGATGAIWTTPSGGTFNPNANDPNATWTPPPGFSGTATLTITTSGLACTPATDHKDIVVSAQPVISTHPGNKTDCEGAFVNFSVVASGSGLTYTWQRKKPLEGSFSNIPAEPNETYPSPGTIRLENVGNSDAPDGTQYRVVITNTNNCSVVSNPATLTVNEIKGITPSTTHVTICQGNNYSYLVTTSYPSNVVSYQWKKWINPGQWDPVTDGDAISGATTEHLVFTGATPSESGEYKVTIVFHSSGAECNVTSDSRQRVLTVNPIPSCSISGPNSVYAGSVNNSYTSTPIPSDNVNHSWSISGNGTIVGSTTGATITITAVAVGSYTLRDDISRYECTSYCTYEVIVTNLPCSITPDTSVPSSATTIYSAPAGMDSYSWSVTGNGSITSGLISQTVEVLAGNSCSTYTVKLAMAKNGANSNCEHTITVTDTIRPTFTLPTLATGYCVEAIFQAVYNDVPDGDPLDLTYPRPDYYIFGVGFTMLNLPSYSDNCALKAPEPISWTIDFGNNGSIEYSGNGQLSAYGTAIHFPVGTNRITCTVTDAVGNTRVKFVDLVVIPRPVMTKIF